MVPVSVLSLMAVRSPESVSSECHMLVDTAVLTKITDLIFFRVLEVVLGIDYPPLGVC
jgi:hypothetical protein